jgi:hypothetical protein
MSTQHSSNTRMTISLPSEKHKELKALSALLGIPMKDFIVDCIVQRLDEKLREETLEEKRDAEAFDRGMKSLKEKGGISLEEMKKRLGIE